MAFVNKANGEDTKGVPLSSDLRALINEMENCHCDKITCIVPYGIYSKVARHALAGIAQLVEHRAFGHQVLGSNLASATYSGSDIGWSLQW